MQNKRFYLLDFLKLLSSIVIVFCHYQQITGIRFSVFNFYGGNYYLGYIVELFFMISGFVTFISISNKKERSFIDYISKKVRRLYPTVFISTTLCIFMTIIYHNVSGEYFLNVDVNVISILSNYLMIFPIIGITGFNNPLWYITVLIVCYILFWLISKCSKANKKYLYLSVVILASIMRKMGIGIPFFTEDFTRGYACFFIGVLLGTFVDFINDNKKIKTISLVTFISTVVAFVLNKDFYNWYVLVFLTMPSLLIICLDLSKYIRFNIISNWSYYIYAFHLFFIYVLEYVKFINAFSFINLYDELFFMLIYVLIIVVICYLFARCNNRKNVRLNCI